MIKNYLLTTWRTFFRRRSFSLLNAIGLAIGLAASILIYQYVKDELSYDRFHTHRDNVYRVEYDAYRNGRQIFKSATTFPKVGLVMKTDFPEVEDATRIFQRYGGGVIRYEDIFIKEDNVYHAEQNFFSIFSYVVTEGVAKLDQPNTAVIEVNTARKYFGNQSPIGKRIKFGANEDYEITGVVQSPENSHLKFTFLFSFPTLVKLFGDNVNSSWRWYDFYTYVLLKSGTDIKGLEAKFPPFIDKYGTDGTTKGSERSRFVLQPLQDIHLHSDLIQEARVNGSGSSVYFLGVIAFFILIIAWVNYVNLATARSLERAKEVGIRKSVGARKGQLVMQFMSESVIVNFSASVLALFLFFSALPVFNDITGKNLTGTIFYEVSFWMLLFLLTIVGSLLAGLYPSFVLSSFQPSKVLKGKMKNSKEGLLLRRSLVVGQFVASVILIAGTIIVYNQVQFMQNGNLGIDIDQTLVINAPGNVDNDLAYKNYLQSFRNSISSNPDVKTLAATTEIPGNLIFWTNRANRVGDDVSQQNQMYQMGIDYEFFKTFGNKILAGRGYSTEFTGDSSSVVLNQKAVEIFNLKTPENAVGQKMQIGGDTLNIVGVVENYHQEGLKQDFRPTAFRFSQNARAYFCIKLNTQHLKQTVAFLKEKYATIFPNNPFDYFFLDSFFNRQYENDKRFGSVFGFFAALAIFVACLGLFGLASFTAAQRTKEIGIRKVLGSTVARIFLMLSKDFLKLVLFANIIAVPISWFIMEKWLSGFAFRINVGVWIFAVAGVITTLIALVTVSYQSITAAMSNPVKSLRSE